MSDSTIDEVMKSYAEEAVAFAQERFGFDLDYSEQSLLDLDAILESLTEQGLVPVEQLDEEAEEVVWGFCQMFGGYLGEVILRHVGGAWGAMELEEGSRVVQLTVSDRIKGSPLERVWKRMTESTLATMVGYYRGVQHTLGLEPWEPRD